MVLAVVIAGTSRFDGVSAYLWAYILVIIFCLAADLTDAHEEAWGALPSGKYITLYSYFVSGNCGMIYLQAIA